MLVVDASVLVHDGPDGDRIRHRLRGERLVAPELIDVEVGSVLRRQNRSGQIADRCATQRLMIWPRLRRAAHIGLLGRCWELRQNLTFYNAAYVALAESLQITLFTGDRGLGRATGPLCRIETITP